ISQPAVLSSALQASGGNDAHRMARATMTNCRPALRVAMVAAFGALTHCGPKPSADAPEVARPSSKPTLNAPRDRSLATSTSDASSSPAEAPPAFHATVSDIEPVRDQIRGSWHPGCPVDLSHLRTITCDHFTFAGTIERGTIIVNEDAVEAVRS